MAIYAYVTGTPGTCIQTTAGAGPAGTTPIDITSVVPQPSAGWTVDATGMVWTNPFVPIQANAAAIQTRVKANLTTLESWITAHPTGATLTAAQTLTVAKMLVGLCRLLLQEFDTTGGS